MKFTVDHLVTIVYELERVGAVAVHVAMPIGNATIRKQEHDLVRRLRS